MQKILIVSAVFPPEPVVSASISYELANKLSENYNVTVVCPKPSRPKGKVYDKTDSAKEPFERIVLDSFVCPSSNFIGRLKESFSLGMATKKYIEQNHDNINCAYLNTWPMLAQYITLKTLKKYNIPSVLHIQDIYPESMLPRLGFFGRIVKNILLKIDKRYLSIADEILAISDNMKSYLCMSRGFNKNSVHVVRNWQDNTKFTIFSDIKNDKFTFMFLGSISPAADVPFLVKSFIKSGLENARMIVAGDGSDREKCETIAKANKSSDIHFCSVSPEDVPRIQSKADVLLLPLRKGVGITASPSKLPAYMFSSKPIIACVDYGTDVEYVINSCNCGWITSPENENELVEKMEEVVNISAIELSEMGKRAKLYAECHFTKDINLQKIVSVISNLVNNGSQSCR